KCVYQPMTSVGQLPSTPVLPSPSFFTGMVDLSSSLTERFLCMASFFRAPLSPGTPRRISGKMCYVQWPSTLVDGLPPVPFPQTHTPSVRRPEDMILFHMSPAIGVPQPAAAHRSLPMLSCWLSPWNWTMKGKTENMACKGTQTTAQSFSSTQSASQPCSSTEPTISQTSIDPTEPCTSTDPAMGQLSSGPVQPSATSQPSVAVSSLRSLLVGRQ
ncbi:hypothetical protein P4O66_015034, partial [Electrophorus voltai]